MLRSMSRSCQLGRIALRRPVSFASSSIRHFNDNQNQNQNHDQGMDHMPQDSNSGFGGDFNPAGGRPPRRSGGFGEGQRQPRGDFGGGFQRNDFGGSRGGFDNEAVRAQRRQAQIENQNSIPPLPGQRESGAVKWFDPAKGFGFLYRIPSNEQIFVHFSNIAGNGYRSLEEGQQVDFIVVPGTKGPVAQDVRIKP